MLGKLTAPTRSNDQPIPGGASFAGWKEIPGVARTPDHPLSDAAPPVLFP